MFITLPYYIPFSSTYSKILIFYIPYFLFCGVLPKMKGAKIICAGLLNPIPGISRAIAEAESPSKGIFLYSYQTFTHFKSSEISHVRFNSCIQYTISVLHLFTDADDQPADNLSKVAAINIESTVKNFRNQ